MLSAPDARFPPAAQVPPGASERIDSERGLRPLRVGIGAAEALDEGAILYDDAGAAKVETVVGEELQRARQRLGGHADARGEAARREGQLRHIPEGALIDQPEEEGAKPLGRAAAFEVEDVPDRHPPLAGDELAH